MPEPLKIEGDQRFFEHGLDQVDAVVHGALFAGATRALVIAPAADPHDACAVHRVRSRQRADALAESGRRLARAGPGCARHCRPGPRRDRRLAGLRTIPLSLRRFLSLARAGRAAAERPACFPANAGAHARAGAGRAWASVAGTPPDRSDKNVEVVTWRRRGGPDRAQGEQNRRGRAA